MSKISSKLAAGVRKVKTEQQADEGAKRRPESAPAEKPSRSRQQRHGNASDLHPARVWPD